jgi:NAD(P)-dependent dehydrogenase (short-subunit alcohol dehydrogenase family)
MNEKYTNLFKLDGKVALVAGGGGGIGSAISEGLSALGATVVITDFTEAGAAKTVETIQKSGGKAEGYALDASKVSEINSLVQKVGDKYNFIDILVNCVGTHVEEAAEDYSEEIWDKIFTINLKAAFFLSQAVANQQIGKGGGSHMHLTSVRSELGINRGYVSYCASKGGMVMMIKQVATEWAKHGITVNGIAPTFTNTPLVSKYLNDPDFLNPLLKRIPLGRVCEPLDIAGLAMFLASPAGSFITGQNILIDGGVTATQ